MVRIDAGVQVTETEVIVEAAVTVTVAEPDLVESAVELAVMVAVPGPAGVNTPAALIAPALTVHVTALLKLPVPVTVAVHWEVWLNWMVKGLQDTETEVMAGLGGGAVLLPPPPPQPLAEHNMVTKKSKKIIEALPPIPLPPPLIRGVRPPLAQKRLLL